MFVTQRNTGMNREENAAMMQDMMKISLGLVDKFESEGTDTHLVVGSLIITAVMLTGDPEITKEMIDACAHDLDQMIGDAWKRKGLQKPKGPLN